MNITYKLQQFSPSSTTSCKISIRRRIYLYYYNDNKNNNNNNDENNFANFHICDAYGKVRADIQKVIKFIGV